jgi:hypothetical protein
MTKRELASLILSLVLLFIAFVLFLTVATR